MILFHIRVTGDRIEARWSPRRIHLAASEILFNEPPREAWQWETS